MNHFIMWMAASAALVGPAAAQRMTPAEKCGLYRQVFALAAAAHGPDGVGPEFVARNAAFIESGCTAAADVCPRSPSELKLADAVTMKGVAQRLTGSFMPFACPKRS